MKSENPNHSSQGSHTPAANQLFPPRLLWSGSRRIAQSSKSCNRSGSEIIEKLILVLSAPASVLLKLEKTKPRVPKRKENDPRIRQMQKGLKQTQAKEQNFGSVGAGNLRTHLKHTLEKSQTKSTNAKRVETKKQKSKTLDQLDWRR